MFIQFMFVHVSFILTKTKTSFNIQNNSFSTVATGAASKVETLLINGTDLFVGGLGIYLNTYLGRVVSNSWVDMGNGGPTCEIFT